VNGAERQRRARLLRAALTSMLVVALTTVPVGDAVAASQAPAGTIRLKVMSFNIWYGGWRTGLDAVAKAIRTADADVVGLQEPYGHTRQIARRLGWYAAPRLHTISRFPIVQPGTNGRYGYLLLSPGQVVAIANNHNPCCPYGPNLVRVATPKAEVLALERRLRLPWQKEYLDALAPLVAAGDMPIFFAGDFNSPSHRDWTPAAVRALGWQPPDLRAKGPRYPMRWPVTVAIEEAGFRDSYREIYPNPVTDPGYTWTAGHPGLAPWDVFDRIDYVWTAGPTTTLRSRIVGPGDASTDITSRPWPSDHRALVSTFRLTPGGAPRFVGALDLRTWLGRSVRTAFHLPLSPTRTVGLWTKGADPSTDPAAAEVSIPDGVRDGEVQLSTAGLEPGVYVIAGTKQDGTVLTSSQVTVVDGAEPAAISTDRRRYAGEQPIRVTWSGGPGNRYDWLGVYAAGGDPARDPLRQWRYVQGRIDGSAVIDRASEGVWPIRPGRYQVFLCVDDDYRCVAASEPFRIEA
jgi:endonuclease/exonuclease/phosphatase family metal-dependent hydrolase